MRLRGVLEDLKRKGLRVKEGEPLWRYTTVRVGGAAALMVFPQRVSELEILWDYLSEKAIPCFWLSGGSKVLFADEGFSGVVVNLRGLAGVRELSPGRLEVLCGTPVAALIAYGLKRGLGGVEFLAGIPATVGGAIFMNAGAFGKSMGELVEEVWVLNEEGLVRVPGEPGLFAYRRFRGPGGVLVKAIVRLAPASPAEVRERIFGFLAARRDRQPLGRPSFGCAFKNPESGPAAGWLLERAGLKGRSRGRALISPKHANFILNLGGARSRDILALMEEARERVFRFFGFTLEPEVQVVGRA